MTTNMENIVNQVKDYLEKDDWKYIYDDKNTIIETGCTIKGKLSQIRLLIRFSDTGFSIVAYSPLNAAEECRPAVMEFITRVNYPLRYGGFRLDLSDGEILYQHYTDCEGTESLSTDVIENSVTIPLMMWQIFGNSIAMLLMGFSTPELEFMKYM